MYIIVVGAGQIGSQVIDIATQDRNEVVVIEKDEKVARDADADYDCLVINDDATTKDTLMDAGADRADALITTTDEDAVNLMVMMLARDIGIRSLVSVVHTPSHMKFFREIGVNIIENPQRLIAEYLYRSVKRPSIKDFMDLAGDAEVFEITVTGDSELAGKTLIEADEQNIIPNDLVIVAVERGTEVLTPRGKTELKEGDLVTVFSKRGAVDEVTEIFAPENV